MRESIRAKEVLRAFPTATVEVEVKDRSIPGGIVTLVNDGLNEALFVFYGSDDGSNDRKFTDEEFDNLFEITNIIKES